MYQNVKLSALNYEQSELKKNSNIGQLYISAINIWANDGECDYKLQSSCFFLFVLLIMYRKKIWNSDCHTLSDSYIN